MLKSCCFFFLLFNVRVYILLYEDNIFLKMEL